MELKLRPIDAWPGVLTRQRESTPFDSTYSNTLKILQRELDALGARNCVVQIALREEDFRIDGSIRANARPVGHPGVILSFDSKHGPLRYFTDRYQLRYSNSGRQAWHENLRAIALGLEALRKIERYGIANRAEQYTGWKAIGSGIAMGPRAEMSIEEAAKIIAGGTASWSWIMVRDDPNVEKMAYREASKLVHPDTAGDDAEAKEKFQLLQQAHQVLVEVFKASGRV